MTTEALSTVYREAGYARREIGFGQRPAIVVVDFQKAFTDPTYPLGRSPLIHAAVEKTGALLQLARQKQVPILYTVVSFREDLQDFGFWKISPEGLIEGSPGTEVSPEVAPGPHDVVLIKKKPSAFFETPLLSLLTEKRVDTVIVTGCVTSGCIRATIIDSFSHGFRTIVPEDCVGDQTEEQHRANLFDVAQRYADVVDSETVSEYLRNL